MTTKLIEAAVERGATNPPGRLLIHGEGHWKCVAMAGLWIAERMPVANADFILVFAQLHDMMRVNDGHDPWHGQRAALLYRKLVATRQAREWEAMGFALSFHQAGFRSEHQDPNVGICWDADRVNLWRVSIEPDPALLSTEAGSSREAIEYGRQLCGRQLAGDLPSWAEITGP